MLRCEEALEETKRVKMCGLEDLRRGKQLRQKPSAEWVRYDDMTCVLKFEIISDYKPPFL